MQQSFDRDLMILLHDVARILRTRTDRAARMHGMTRAQWIILARLSKQPGISQNELAAICEVEPITIGRLVDRLEARELVARCSDPSDRRVWRLKLLPAAAPIIEEITAYRSELNAELVEGLTAEGLSQITEMLVNIKEKLALDVSGGTKLQAAEG